MPQQNKAKPGATRSVVAPGIFVVVICLYRGRGTRPVPAPDFPAVLGKFLAEKWGGGDFGPILGHNP